MTSITKRERQLCALLLNQMAFEYAHEHVRLSYPDVDLQWLEDIEKIVPPKPFDPASRQYKKQRSLSGKNVAEQCFTHFRKMRDNLIHANKSLIPDADERLEDLLRWSDSFANYVYSLDVDFSKSAQSAKSVLKIENI